MKLFSSVPASICSWLSLLQGCLRFLMSLPSPPCWHARISALSSDQSALQKLLCSLPVSPSNMPGAQRCIISSSRLSSSPLVFVIATRVPATPGKQTEGARNTLMGSPELLRENWSLSEGGSAKAARTCASRSG